MLLAQHFRGSLTRPGRCQTLGPVGDPIGRQRHERCVLREHIASDRLC